MPDLTFAAGGLDHCRRCKKRKRGGKKSEEGEKKKKERGGKEEETEKGESKEAAITTRNEIRETTVESAPYWTTDERSSLDGTLEF